MRGLRQCACAWLVLVGCGGIATSPSDAGALAAGDGSTRADGAPFTGVDAGRDAPPPDAPRDAPDCPPQLTRCNEVCVDLSSDDSNCGVCGAKCGTGNPCIKGACPASDCPGGVFCNGGCYDPMTDSDHCGATGDCVGPNAGQVCKGDEICDQGRCLAACGSGLTRCALTCVDLQKDPSNCGSCGTKCGNGSSCALGQCSDPGCPLLCNGSCVNPVVDNANCGACGNVCAPGQVCYASACHGVDAGADAAGD